LIEGEADFLEVETVEKSKETLDLKWLNRHWYEGCNRNKIAGLI
jgi:hypothetical protein